METESDPVRLPWAEFHSTRTTKLKDGTYVGIVGSYPGFGEYLEWTRAKVPRRLSRWTTKELVDLRPSIQKKFSILGKDDVVFFDPDGSRILICCADPENVELVGMAVTGIVEILIKTARSEIWLGRDGEKGVGKIMECFVVDGTGMRGFVDWGLGGEDAYFLSFGAEPTCGNDKTAVDLRSDIYFAPRNREFVFQGANQSILRRGCEQVAEAFRMPGGGRFLRGTQSEIISDRSDYTR